MYGEKFKGYLMKFPKTGEIFPDKYLNPSSYKTTPQQRTEKKANRDALNNLHRVTLANHKSKIVFSTTSLTLAELREILGMINRAYISKIQRKFQIEYWDDELLKYRTMTVYMADVTYTKKKITSDSIDYDPIEFTFVEY